MSSWGFLRSGRWAGYLGLAVVFALVCVFLGNWQFDRRAQAREQIALVENNYDIQARPLDEVLADAPYDDSTMKWTPVLLEGRYLADDEVLVRNRPLNGRPGFHSLVPFELDDGTVFLVDRGWLSVGNEQDAPDTDPAPPAGEVAVTARLHAAEPALPGRGAPEGQAATIEVGAILDELGLDGVRDSYGVLADEQPAATGDQPVSRARPVPDEGPHLSYALQWYVFALLGFGALAYGAAQERRGRLEDELDATERESRTERRRRAKGGSDAAAEDAILDAEEPITRAR